MDLSEKLAGRFIVLDGPDGCGKTTQIARLAARLSADGGEPVCVRDPGGTRIGDDIRRILLDADTSDMDVRCEMLLFMASRAQLVREHVAPALASNRTVLCDRFISATCAYQAAGGIEPGPIMTVAEIAVGDCWPDLTIVLDVDLATGADRMGRRLAAAAEGSAGLDAMVRRPKEFHARVREMFRRLPEVYPRRVEILDASGDIEEVHERIVETIERVIV